MNIAGFVLFSIFAAVCFWLSKIMKDDSPEKYAAYPKANATVSHTMQSRDHDSPSHYTYRYIVGFVDREGNNVIGISERFSKKRTLQNGQAASICYWEPRNTSDRKLLQQIVTQTANTISSVLTGVPQRRDARPKYRIHFCDPQIYALENAALKKTSIFLAILGCGLLLCGVLILLK